MSLIEVKHLKKYFDTPRGMVHAVDDVTFRIDAGTTMGVVGESGCGKSTLGRTMIHLNESTDGEIWFDGKNVTNIKGQELKDFREQVQFIFQDPFSSLNPAKKISWILEEPLRMQKVPKEERKKRVLAMAERVGLSAEHLKRRPHELSGGQRQRVSIAAALIQGSRLILADEPVSALDVTIQKQIMELLEELKDTHGLSFIFICHNLALVQSFCDKVLVLYDGKVVESGKPDDIINEPKEAYTKKLVDAVFE